ncbi:MAG: hypothetical protein CSA23_04965 [Deltaproteobacteria bacterium]|nr:MAG: hypothetical protein CSA23_04965 [Deltaproteobacteria bacterium]
MGKNILQSPTGQGVRVDNMGDGHYGAQRNRNGHTYPHKGVDFLCKPGQSVVSPISGTITRLARPYSKGPYSGCVIENKKIKIKMFYVDVPPQAAGKAVFRGEHIGIAQDISLKYGREMKPHIHMQVERVDPELLLQEGL